MVELPCKPRVPYSVLSLSALLLIVVTSGQSAGHTTKRGFSDTRCLTFPAGCNKKLRQFLLEALLGRRYVNQSCSARVPLCHLYLYLPPPALKELSPSSSTNRPPCVFRADTAAHLDITLTILSSACWTTRAFLTKYILLLLPLP
ncbi:hypothetical protein F5Y16DRAFT_205255 [Xylariaceae sp. FL0255]|nr:hypothetical protein F5Y16DRAFT_205255 [Xylariaceae sp. FL0255]